MYDKRQTISRYNLTESSALGFLYNNAFGRGILKAITLPFISKVAGLYMSSPMSKLMIKNFIRKNDIDMSDYVDDGYKCFNDFFTRKIKDGKRQFPHNKNILFSPCDGKLSAYRINDGTVLPIKGSGYTIEQLLNNKDLADKYNGGICVVLRLAVDDYHRYCYIDNAEKGDNIFIKGRLHTVQPIALEKLPVFVQNSREYTVMDTENFGEVIQIEVGALMVGKIKNHHGKCRVKRSDEKGMFLFGGSTIVLLFQNNKVKLESEFFANTNAHKETVVKMGENIGEKFYE